MKVIFVQLNEINFEVVNEYIKIGYDLDYFEKILKNGIDTFEDEVYENLEPWIQWFSIFNGKSYKNHKVFRLGDGLKFSGDNLYSDIRNNLKKKCGAVCPMNISSKEIDFDFFIPDPWSCEKIKGDLSLKFINESIKQGVNDNSGMGLNLLNKIKLIIGLLLNLNIKDLKNLFVFFKNIKRFNFRKALFLDYILVLLQKSLTRKYKTEFTSIFLNGGAHIQHHYFLNSKVIKNKYTLRNPSWYMEDKIDPIVEMLIFYNKILKSYEKDGYEIILMTGLQQIPYTSVNYYYRLINHKNFFNFLGIKIKNILTRMTRDFEILFENNNDRDYCAAKICKITDIDGIKIFDDIELRNNSIFTSLTYNKEITESKIFIYEEKTFNLFYYVNFVAIKNGKHHKNGKIYISRRNLLVDDDTPMELSTIRSFLLKELSRISG